MTWPWACVVITIIVVAAAIVGWAMLLRTVGNDQGTNDEERP